jgi:hypothetical protein
VRPDPFPVAGAEDVLDAEVEVGHGCDDHGYEIGGAARAMAVAEHLGQIVPDKGRIEQFSGVIAEGAVVDRVHGAADHGDGIAGHDHSVPDPGRRRHLGPVSWPRVAAGACALGLRQQLPSVI